MLIWPQKAVPPAVPPSPLPRFSQGRNARARAGRSRSNIFALSQFFIEFRLDRWLASLLYEEDQFYSVFQLPLTYKGWRRNGRIRIWYVTVK